MFNATLSFFILLAMTVVTEIAAANEGCRFQERGHEALFNKLPEEVIGWADCEPKKEIKINSMAVAQMRNPNRQEIVSLFKRYEAVMEPMREITIINREKHLEGGDWFEFETKRGTVGSDVHYLFTKSLDRDHVLVFIYTDTAERARNRNGLVHDIRNEIIKSGFKLMAH